MSFANSVVYLDGRGDVWDWSAIRSKEPTSGRYAFLDIPVNHLLWDWRSGTIGFPAICL